MNTYFLRLLSNDKNREKGKCSVFYRDTKWAEKKEPPRGIKVGDIVDPNYDKSNCMYLYLGDNFWRLFDDDIYFSLEVTDHKFNPFYWGK